MENIIYLNGNFIPLQKARISALDYGFLYGYGIFETMRAYHSIVFRLNSHLKRLAASAESLKIPVTVSTCSEAVIEIIRVNRLQDARVRLAVSIGEGSLIPDAHSCSQPTILIAATPFIPYKPEIYVKGYHLIVSSTRRCSRSSLIQMKTANYLESLLAREEARSNGADEALLLNEKNYVTETSASNIFLITQNILKTPCPGSGLLPGITREIVLEQASRMGIKVLETDIELKELLNADEVFLTNSIIEIMPVTAIDDNKIATGKPGLITRKLTETYKNIVKKETINLSRAGKSETN